MKYTKGKIKQVFLVKFENEDILAKELEKLIRKERIRCAVFVFLGALKQGNLVTGPKKAVIPPEPNWVAFKDGWEVLGLGTVFSNKSGPQIHIHSAMGKKNKTLTGCVRKDSKVFIVIEAVIFELEGIRAQKDIDPQTGLNMLKIL
ncbi:MAG: DUF296 domain-containing protein [Candidatus Omnitrophota bacterium]|nr:DUF296 domain-containing protein [Candidatus Omnitrophota bacterium]